MRCRPSWANSNNPVPTVRFMKTSIATGAQDENRTHDLRITSALLYRLSYLGKASYSTDETVNGTTDRLRLVSFLFRASNSGLPKYSWSVRL